jgi:hypothetical protein
MAEAEADAVEAEDVDDDEDEDAEPVEDAPLDETEAEPDAEPEAIAPELSMEQRAELLETALRLHHENMAGFFGPDWADMEACPMCSGIGAVGADSPVLDPTTMRCERCKGHGVLLTEAVNPNNVTRGCPDCMGNGYVPRVEVPQPVPQVPVPAYGQPFQQAGTQQPQPPQIPPMPIFDAAANVWRDPTTGEQLGPMPPGNHSTSGLVEVSA